MDSLSKTNFKNMLNAETDVKEGSTKRVWPLLAADIMFGIVGFLASFAGPVISCACVPVDLAVWMAAVAAFILSAPGALYTRGPVRLIMMAAELVLLIFLSLHLKDGARIFIALSFTLRNVIRFPARMGITLSVLMIAFIVAPILERNHDSEDVVIGRIIGWTGGYTLGVISVYLSVFMRRALRELAKAHHQLRVYAKGVEETAALRERSRMTRDLHDALGHKLTILNIDIENATRLFLVDAEKSHEFLEQARAIALSLLADVRATVQSFAVDPMQRDHLRDLIRVLVEECKRTTGVQIESFLNLTIEDPVIKTTIVRIIEEALTNVMRHANATHVALIIEDRDRDVLIKVSDDGDGFDADGATSGYGLRSIRERAEVAGGTLSVASGLGSGTTLIVKLPRTDAALHS